MADNISQLSDAELDAQLAATLTDQGLDIDETKKEINQDKFIAEQALANKVFNEKERVEKQRQQGIRRMAAYRVGDRAMEIGADVAMGLGLGATDLVKNTWNGVIGIADKAESFLQEQGFTQNDYINDSQKLEDVYRRHKEEMGDAGKAAYAMYKIAAPFAAGGLVTKAPLITGTVVDAVYNYFANDPDGGRLSDLAKDTPIENIPIIGQIIGKMQTQPDDTEVEGRLKNMAEGLTIATPFLAYQAGKALGMFGKVRQGVNAGTKITNIADDVPPAGAAPAAAQAVDGVPAITGMEPAPVTAAPAASQPIPNTPQAQKVAAAKAAAGTPPAVNTGEVIDGVPTKAAASKPLTQAELDASDKAISETRQADYEADILGADKPLVEVVPDYGTPEIVKGQTFQQSDSVFTTTQDALDRAGVKIPTKEMKIKDGKIELKRYVDPETGETYIRVSEGKGRGKSFISEADLVRTSQEAPASKVKVVGPKGKTTTVVDESLPPRADGTRTVGPAVNGMQAASGGAAATTPTASLPKTKVNVRPDSQAISSVANAVAKGEVDLMKPLGRQQYAAAKAAVQADPKKLEDALNGRIFGKEKEHLLKFYVQALDEKLAEVAAHVATHTDDEAAMVHLAELLSGQATLSKALAGVNSGNGKIIQAPSGVKWLAAALGSSEKAAIKTIGQQGRAMLYGDIIKRAGGKDQLVKNAQTLSIIKRIQQIQGLPDEAFTQTMQGVRMKSRYDLYTNVINRALDSALLSVSGAYRVVWQNGALIAAENTARYIGAGIGTAKGMFMQNSDKATIQEALQYSKGTWIGWMDTMPNVLEGDVGAAAKTAVGKTGVTIRGKSFESNYQSVGVVAPLPSDTAENVFWRFMNQIDRTVGTPLAKGLESVSGIIPNLYAGADLPAKFANYHGFMMAEATNLGTKMKLSGDELTTFIKDFAEGNSAGKHMDSPAILNRWSTADQAATTHAQVLTGAGEVEGAAGALKDAWDKTGRRVPVVGSALPFLRATMQQIRSTVTYSPMAFMYPNVRKAIMAGGREGDLALGRIAVGTSAMAMLITAVQNGYVRGEATDWKLTNALREHKEPSGAAIKIGDTWHDLGRMGYVTTMVNMASLYSKGSGHFDDEGNRQLLYDMGSGLLELMSPQMVAETVGNLSGLITGKLDFEGFSAKFLASRTPTVNLADSLRVNLDPTARTTQGDDFYQQYKNHVMGKVPWLSEKVLPVLNYWGEEVKMPDGVGFDSLDSLAGESAETVLLQDTLRGYVEYGQRFKKFDTGYLDINFKLAPDNIPNNMWSEANLDSAAQTVAYPLSSKEKWVLQKYMSGYDPDTGKEIAPEDYPEQSLKKTVLGILNEYKAIGRPIDDFADNEYASMLAEIGKAQRSYYNFGIQYMQGDESMKERFLEQVKQKSTFSEAVEAAGGIDVGQ